MLLNFDPEAVPLEMSPEGVVKLHGSRLPLDTIVEDFNDGASAEEIADWYGPLNLADVYVIIGYYLRHRSEVDAYLREREVVRAQIRAENEARFNTRGLRERLLARARRAG